MAYTTVARTILKARSLRDIKSAVPRTQLYARLLQRKHGVSAKEMKAAVHAAFPDVADMGFTPHNSYSLQLMAANYGFQFLPIVYTDMGKLDGTRYFFRSDKNAEIFDAALAEAAPKPRAPRKAKTASVPMPIVSNPEAKAAQRAEKAALADATMTVTGANTAA